MVTFYISILNREAYTQISETCDECRVGGLLGSDGKGEGITSLGDCLCWNNWSELFA